MLNIFFRRILLFFSTALLITNALPLHRAEAMPPTAVLPPLAGQRDLPDPMASLALLALLADTAPGTQDVIPERQTIDLLNIQDTQQLNRRLLGYINSGRTHIPTHLIIDERFIDQVTVIYLGLFKHFTELTIYFPEENLNFSGFLQSNPYIRHIRGLHLIFSTTSSAPKPPIAYLQSNWKAMALFTYLLSENKFPYLETLSLENFNPGPKHLAYQLNKLRDALKENPQLKNLNIQGLPL